jgi:hypothetical protein
LRVVALTHDAYLDRVDTGFATARGMGFAPTPPGN